MSSRLLVTTIVAVLLFSGADAGRAEDLIAVKPGLICRSAEVLAKLTLPDGSSRADSPTARVGDRSLKKDGSCFDVPAGLRVPAVAIRKNTAVVVYDPGAPVGEQTFYVATVDFRRAGDAVENAGAATGLAPAAPPPDSGEQSSRISRGSLDASATSASSQPSSDGLFESQRLTPTFVSFAYDKLLALPPDVVGMARNTTAYQTGSVFDRDAKANNLADLLRAEYRSFDPDGRYLLETNESLTQFDPQTHSYHVGQGPGEYWDFPDPADSTQQQHFHLQFDNLEQFDSIPFPSGGAAEQFADRFTLNKTNDWLGSFRAAIVMQFVRASPSDGGPIRDLIGHIVAMRLYAYNGVVMHDFGAAPEESQDARGFSRSTLKAADLQSTYLGMKLSDFEAAVSARYPKLIGSFEDGKVLNFRDYNWTEDPTGCGDILGGPPDFGSMTPAAALSAGFSSCLAAQASFALSSDVKSRTGAPVSKISSMQLLDTLDPAAILRSLRSKYGPETDLKSPSDIVWRGADPAHPNTTVQIEAVIKQVVNTDPPKGDLEITMTRVEPKAAAPTPMRGASAPTL